MKEAVSIGGEIQTLGVRGGVQKVRSTGHVSPPEQGSNRPSVTRWPTHLWVRFTYPAAFKSTAHEYLSFPVVSQLLRHYRDSRAVEKGGCVKKHMG